MYIDNRLVLNDCSSNNAQTHYKQTGLETVINNDFVDKQGGSARDIFDLVMSSDTFEEAYENLPYKNSESFAQIAEAYHDIKQKTLDETNEWSLFLK